MAKFPEAEARMFKNMFVCRKCKSRIRTTNLRVLAGKTSCRKCGGKALKPVRKK
ncbi:50S ribosomal protein L40e [Candidatus Woesearchaeota archaeon]|nr:50S ribosomal protein L40e [Candidatus Woesearchaeota archaeon]